MPLSMDNEVSQEGAVHRGVPRKASIPTCSSVGTSGFIQTTACERDGTTISADNTLSTFFKQAVTSRDEEPPEGSYEWSCWNYEVTREQRASDEKLARLLGELEQVTIEKEESKRRKEAYDRRYDITSINLEVGRLKSTKQHKKVQVDRGEPDEFLQAIRPELRDVIEHELSEGRKYKEQIQKKREWRKTHSQRRRDAEYEKMSKAPAAAEYTPSESDLFEKEIRRGLYRTRMWACKVERSKQHVRETYCLRQQTHQFVASLPFDASVPARGTVRPQPERPDVDWGYQADEYTREDPFNTYKWMQGLFPEMAKKFPPEWRDAALKRFESVILLMANLQQATTWTHMGTILLAWVASQFDRSMTTLLSDAIQRIVDDFGVEMKSQSSEWFDKAQALFNDWKSVAHGDVIARVKKIIALLVSAGVCSFTALPFGMEKFEEFYKCSGISKMTTVDIMTYVFETVLFMWERGLAWFTTGKWRSFFKSRTLSQKYEEEYAFLMSKTSIIENGTLTELGMEETEYMARMDVLLEQTKEYMSTIQSAYEKNILAGKLLNVEKLKARMFEATRNVAQRRKPYTVLFFGTTNIGKSVMISACMNGMARACGIPTGPKYKVSLNTNDAYQSEVRSWHNQYVFDDMANTQVMMMKGNVCQLMIDAANNEPKFALKADVGSKGQVLMAPLLICGSTNVKDLDSSKVSNCPMSVMRRIDVIVTPKVRDQYSLPNNRGLDTDKTHGLIGEYCTFKLERAVPIRTNPTTSERINQPQDRVGYEVISYKFEGEAEPRLMDNISYHELVVYLNENSKAHLLKQAKLLKEIEHIHEKELCDHNSYSEICPTCARQKSEQQDSEIGMENQSGKSYDWAVAHLKQTPDLLKRLVFSVPQKMQTRSAESYEKIVSSMTQSLVHYACSVVTTAAVVAVCVFQLVYSVLGAYPACVATLMVYTFVAASLMRARFDRVVRSLAAAPFNVLVGGVKQMPLTTTLAGLAAVIAAVTYLRRMYVSVKTLSSLTAQSEERVPTKDAVQRVNHWKPVYISKPPVDVKLFTSTADQVVNMVAEKLCMADFYTGPRGERCNVFPLKSNVWLVPKHVIAKGYTHIKVQRCPKGQLGPTFTSCIDSSVWTQVGKTDLAVVYLPAGGSQADLSHLFPDGITQGHNAAAFVFKRDDGSVMLDKVNAKHCGYTVDEAIVPSLSYTMTNATFPGLCMGTLISQGRAPYVMGFHIAGMSRRSDSPLTREQEEQLKNGVAAQVTREMLSKAVEKLYATCPIAIEVASESEMKLGYDDQSVTLCNDLHYKSPHMYIEPEVEGSVTLLGSHTGRRRRWVSDVIPSCISEQVETVFGVPNKWGPPKNMNSYQPWRADVQNLLNTRDLPPELVGRAYEDFREKIFGALKPEDKERIHPYTLPVALAGADGVYGVDALNPKTSTGWCWKPEYSNKKKYTIMTPSDKPVEGITRPLEIPEDMEEEILRAEEKMARGERMYFVHRANLKDEPTKLDKDKVRVFAGSPLVLSIIFRKYFLSICKFIMENSLLFECAVGVNAHGPEWSELVTAMAKYGADRMIAGDYKAFDSTMAAMMTLLGFKLMMEIAEWAGYTERQLAIMRGVATEVCYPLYEYNGEFVMYNCSNPSGHPGTVFINSFVGSLYFRIAYYALTPLGKKTPLFHKIVSLLTYGDDNASSVKEGFAWFNHTSIAKILKEFGIVYTMADKTAESIPYIGLHELEFLKRKPVWDDELNVYMAPLREESILKSLHSVKRSKDLSPEEHASACIIGAVSEYFQHGEQVYNDRVQKLEKVIDMAGIRSFFPDQRLPTYEERKTDYISKYLDVSQGHSAIAVEVPVLSGYTPQGDVYNLYHEDIEDEDVALWLMSLRAISGTDFIRRVDASHCRVVTAGSLKQPYSHRLPQRHRIAKRRCHWRQESKNKRARVSSTGYTAALSLHCSEMDRFATTERQTYMESEVTSIGRHQNLVFRDGAPQWGVGVMTAMDETRMVATHDDVTLGEFLARPIAIASYNWVPGTPFVGVQVDPWSAFFGQTRVINRINNYNLIQPKQLKVKFMINGTSFHYGRMLVHYIPLPNSNTSEGIGQTGRFTIATERMHLMLDPCTSQAGEFTLPFIWPYNALSVPDAEWNQLGQLNIEELVPLKHANGGTAAVNITVYAWAEDVKLSIPTTLNSVALMPQGDEYGTGSVGRLSSTVARVSGALSGVPGIAPFAKATSMVATGMGAVAKAYGFSRPPIVADVTNMRPQLVGPMSNTDRGDNVTKLTLDSKQELTIDPRVFGADTGDEMVLTHLASQQAYLTQFSWPVGTAPGQLLWNVRVNPLMNQLVTLNQGYFLLPCGFAALPFTYWRGTVRYRFQIIASAYHKGRLRFVYDPHRVASNDTNVAYTRIVDLADERDFTIDVAWGQPGTWLNVPSLPYIGANGSTTAYTTDDVVYSNGVLAVYVVNDLTTPNDVPNNDIQIVVQASMCKDAEFNVLSNNHIEGLTYKNQSEVYDNSNVNDTNAPTDNESKECMSECLPIDNTLNVYFGESITSFRTALRRYNYHTSYQNAVAGQTHWQLLLRTFPDSPGLYTTGVNTTTTIPDAGTSCTFAKMTLLNYLAPAFLGQRGGIRSKLCFFSDQPLTTLFQTAARYGPHSVPAQYVNANSAHVVTNPSEFAYTRVQELTSGLQALEVTYAHAQPTLEVEVPYYDPKRFDSAKDIGYTQSGTGKLNLAPNSSFLLDTQMNSTTYSGVDRFVSVGEDFQLFLFQGSPPIQVATYR